MTEVDNYDPNEMTVPSRQIELISSANSDHIAEARKLFLEYGSSLDFNLCFQSFDQELESLPGAYAPPDGKLLLLKYGDHFAGCIGLRKLENEICEMKRLYVRPSDRGHGFGKLLVERLIAEARAMRYRRMRLDTIESSMKDAVALYRRLGFVEIAPYTAIPVEGALWMELLL
jgi:putative acetyltransferase